MRERERESVMREEQEKEEEEVKTPPTISFVALIALSEISVIRRGK